MSTAVPFDRYGTPDEPYVTNLPVPHACSIIVEP